MSAPCVAGHASGSKPQIVPVLGNNDRAVPVFVVYHGRAYLHGDGTVQHAPQWLTYAQASAAVLAHDEQGSVRS